MWEGSHITLFSPSDVTAFHRMKYRGGGVNFIFTEWRHCVSQNSNSMVVCVSFALSCYSLPESTLANIVTCQQIRDDAGIILDQHYMYSIIGPMPGVSWASPVVCKQWISYSLFTNNIICILAYKYGRINPRRTKGKKTIKKVLITNHQIIGYRMEINLR